MKPINNAMIDLILTQSQFAIAELFDFKFLDGSHDYFTDLDQSIDYGGHTYKANSIRIEGMKFKTAVGWQVDEQEIKIDAFPGETLGGASFFEAIESGLLDGGYVTRRRAFYAATSPSTYYVFVAAPVEVVTLFVGRVSSIDKIGRTHVEMKLKSPLSLLDIDMPRNTYQAGCQWRLYDAGCTLNRASFTLSFVVASASATAITPAGGISPINGSDGIANFLQGRLLFTSGANNNLQVLVRDNDGVNFYLQYPLGEVPMVGDTFDVSVGCSKTFATCSTKFANGNNFRAFPRVPPVVVSL